MKKLLFVLTVAVVVGLAGILAARAAAGTITLSPAAKIVSKGQTFTVAVTANPAGGSAYTVKASVRFPANLLEVRSFAFGSGWLPLTQPGYDTTDNASGSLVKTAGYPGGLASSKALGTITFRAKANGVAQVTVAGDSLMLDASNANLFTGGNASTITVQQAAATAAVSPSVSPAPSGSAEPSPSASPELEAAVGAFLGLSGRTWTILGVVIVGLFLVWWFVFRRRKPLEPPMNQ